MERRLVIVGILIIISGIFYYNLASDGNSRETFRVIRVIDGDTVELEDGLRLRLKGINTPEESMIFYSEAKDFLKGIVEGKIVSVESHGFDKYGRLLGYIYLDGVLVNEMLLENGLATLYYYEKDDHYNQLLEVEGVARDKELGIWKKSVNFGCLKLVDLIYKEPGERCSSGERLVITNNCEESINVLIKDDATHIYSEEINGNSNLIKDFSCIWNDDGDSIYVWDDEGLLIFYRY
jgi:micrococcal nuclease